MLRYLSFLLCITVLSDHALATSALVAPSPAIEDGWDASVELPPRWDSWSGYAVTPETSTAFGGVTYALNGDKTRDGWRIRMEGGSGSYGYSSTRTDGLNVFSVDFIGQSTFGSALVGYQWQGGPWTTKVFAGVAYQQHLVGPNDPDNPVVGERWGGKVSVEGWRNVGDGAFASYDVSFGTPFSSYSAQARYGHAIVDNLWLGVEAGGYGNEELNAARAGAFVRWRTDYGTLWMAGGVSGDYDDPTTPYGSVLLVKSF